MQQQFEWLHDSFRWQAEVEKRMKLIELGQ
jgi:hypothetical protein